ncbi:MAG TPA: hypothetical protein VK837_14025 [Longimicrobiales bacterium]|nr:hypothetical protein [Longimicrobiales bacterium]
MSIVEVSARWRYMIWLGLALAWFLFIELTFSLGSPFHPDEFQGAHAVYRLTNELPYRDFLPYKTVLGYYIQLPPFLLLGPGWSGLTAARIVATLINLVALGALALALGRRYRPEAVAVGMVLLVFVSTFVDQAFEIRVDMLTGWCGVLALLLLLNARHGSAGMAAGLAFLISQKGLFFVIAGAIAIAASVLWESRRKHALSGLIRFAVAAGFVIVSYLALWIAVAGFEDVLFITFPAAAGIARRAVYDGIELRWARTAFRNPLFYAIAVLGTVHAAIRAWRKLRARGGGESAGGARDAKLAVFTATLLIQMAAYPQPWSYFFLLAIPVLAVCVVDILDAILADERRSSWKGVAVAGLVVFGVFYPTVFTLSSLHGDRERQRITFETGLSALGPGDTYWAGSNVFADRQQPNGLEWLDLFNLERLRNLPVEERRGLMAELAAEPPAIVIDNYRMRSLPEPFRRFIESHYAYLANGVYSYAVALEEGADSIAIPIRGVFRLEGPGPVHLGGQRLLPGQTMNLPRRTIRVETPSAATLQFVGGLDVGPAPSRAEGTAGFFGVD